MRDVLRRKQPKTLFSNKGRKRSSNNSIQSIKHEGGRRDENDVLISYQAPESSLRRKFNRSYLPKEANFTLHEFGFKFKRCFESSVLLGLSSPFLDHKVSSQQVRV